MTLTKSEIETVRMALYDAISDRETFIQSLEVRDAQGRFAGYMNGYEKIAKRSKSLLAKYRRLLGKIESVRK